MNITVLNGSPRKGANTETMVAEFVRGATDAGHSVTTINVAHKNVKGCLGCKYCFAHGGQCVQKDDMAEILSQLDVTDLVVFASPIYWFDITAQLKAVIDRMYARGAVGFHFRKVALLLNSGSPNVYDAAISQYKMMNAYLKWEDMGILTIPGMRDKDSMLSSPELNKVYALGRSL